MFWYEEHGRGYPNFKLKPAVERVIQELKAEHCANMRAFERVIEAIENLLKIEPTRRTKSKDLVEWMSRVVRQAKSDLAATENEDYYLRKYRENRDGTEVGERLQSERLNPEASPSLTRSHSFSSHHRRSPSRGSATLAHVTSASSVLMQTGSVVSDNGSIHRQSHQSPATDGYGVSGENDELRKELDDL